MFNKQMQQSKDAERKRFKHETETPLEYEHRKYRDTWAKAQKHSHYTPEEQIASQQIDTKRRRVACAVQTPEKNALDSLNNTQQKRKCWKVVKVYEKEQDRNKERKIEMQHEADMLDQWVMSKYLPDITNDPNLTALHEKVIKQVWKLSTKQSNRCQHTPVLITIESFMQKQWRSSMWIVLILAMKSLHEECWQTSSNNPEYICLICYKDLHGKKRKLPAQAVANGLKLTPISEELNGINDLKWQFITLHTFYAVDSHPKG